MGGGREDCRGCGRGFGGDTELPELWEGAASLLAALHGAG